MAVTYFGSSTATGSGVTSLDPNYAWVQQYSVTSTGYITVGRFWAHNTGGTANVRMLCYTDSAGAPNALLGTVSNAVSVPNAGAITEYDVTFPTPFHVNTSDVVWIGTIGDAALLIAYDNAGLNTQYDFSLGSYPNPPNPYGTASTSQAKRAAFQLGVDSSYVPPAALQGVDVAPLVAAAHIF